jgi:hypothetical protein
MTHDVFICHASHDRDVADATCIALEQRGFRCWIAPRNGADRGEAVAAARIFLLIFSAAADSPEVRGEVRRGHALPLVVFRIDDAPPGAELGALLGPAQWVDALTPPIAPHLDYLGDAVAQLLDSARRGPRPQTGPPGRSSPNWLPIALAGAAGMVAIALAAAYAGGKAG